MSNPILDANPEKWVILPIPQHIISPYGKRLLKDKTLHDGKEHKHNGVDLHAPVGTPCLSPLPGRVLRCYWADLGGWQLVIDHGSGICTGWAHLGLAEDRKTAYAPGIDVNSQVSAGQVIAFTGRSGVSGRKDRAGVLLKDGYDPHLHFNVREGRNFMDPAPLLRLDAGLDT